MKPTDQSNFPARELPPIGGHTARCFAIIELGKLPAMFNGIHQLDKKGNPRYDAQIMMCFELSQFMQTFKPEDGPQPCVIMQTYNYYCTDKAKLPKVLASWGRMKTAPEKLTPEMLKMYVGQYCDLSIVHSKDGKYANIQGNGLVVNPYRQGSEKGKPFHENIFFDLDHFSWEAFNKLLPYPQKLIQKSQEWQAIIAKHGQAPVQQGQAKVQTAATTTAEPVMAAPGDAPSF